MFERFTDRTRRVIVLAQEQATELDHTRVLTAHLLLGILGVRDESASVGSAGRLPPEADVADGVDPVVIRGRIDEPSAARDGHLPFSPAAKKVLDVALREAIQRGHADIELRHLLLALIREETGGDAPGLLVITGVDVARLRRSTEDSLRDHPPRPGP